MKKLISNEEYHANPALGSSLLKSILSKSLLHAMTVKFQRSKAMDVGSALHCRLLEPENFEKEFIVSEKFDKRTKAGKLAFAEFETFAAGKTILSPDEYELVMGMLDSLLSSDKVNAMLSGGESEFSYFAKCPETGIKMKCRPDYQTSDYLLDVKTCRDASDNGFTKACIDLYYHVQAAYYLDVYNLANNTNIKDFYFIAVENTAPFAFNLFKMGEVELSLGRDLYKKAINTYGTFLMSGGQNIKDFGYGREIKEIQFPNWALAKNEEKLA